MNRVAFALLPLLLPGCQPSPPRPPDPRGENSHQIRHLEQHRAAFDAYAAGDRSEVVKGELRASELCSWPDVDKSGRVQFDWPSQDPFMSALDDFHPILIFCPNGKTDLPADFWTHPAKYRHPYQIDDHWFAAGRSWMRDPPAPPGASD